MLAVAVLLGLLYANYAVVFKDCYGQRDDAWVVELDLTFTGARCEYRWLFEEMWSRASGEQLAKPREADFIP